MQVIRDLKTKGFKVIACEEGAGSWPIKTKCLPLLAGAVQLLDTFNTEFTRQRTPTGKYCVPGLGAQGNRPAIEHQRPAG